MTFEEFHKSHLSMDGYAQYTAKDAWQAGHRAALEEAPTLSAIEATAALIANGLVGQASEEDVREVERLINELLGME
ncbi:MAG: hypothetical protein OSB38_21165 [Paraburkholderia fungorum]|nr:hypothetical protein [Paraburkholderia fungorum]